MVRKFGAIISPLSILICFLLPGNDPTSAVLLWKKLFLGSRVTLVPEISA